MLCSSYKSSFACSLPTVHSYSFIDDARKEIGNKTRVAIEQCCLSLGHANLVYVVPTRFQKGLVIKFKNDISLMIMTFATVLLHNSSRVSPFTVEDLGFLFDLQGLFG